MGRKIVVKIGGSLLKHGVPDQLMDDLKSLSGSNQLALVHGGGDVVTEFATKLGKEQRFVVSPEGIRSRYTDKETAEIYTMVMSGLLAKRLVLSLQSRGVSAVSVSGLDGRLLQGKRKKKLVVVDDRSRKVMIDGGYTGRIESVNSNLVDLLMSNGYLPVVSPVACSEESEPLNIDGDKAAGSLAAAIHADAVVFLTNVGGLVLDGNLVPKLSAEEAILRLPEIGFGMQRKIMAAADAVTAGVGEAIISSGARMAPATSALAHLECTVIAQR
jgi:acetylglutamate/LysW-gamma-L-alpha-aminoadipate kinase